MPTFNKQDSSIVTINLLSNQTQSAYTYDYNYVVGAYSEGTTLDSNINNFSVQQIQGHGWCQAEVVSLDGLPTYFDVEITTSINTGSQRTAKFNISHRNSDNQTSYIMLNVNQPASDERDSVIIYIVIEDVTTYAAGETGWNCTYHIVLKFSNTSDAETISGISPIYQGGSHDSGGQSFHPHSNWTGVSVDTTQSYATYKNYDGTVQKPGKAKTKSVSKTNFTKTGNNSYKYGSSSSPFKIEIYRTN